MSNITVHLHSADGQVRTIQGRTGRSLMMAATQAGIDEIAADCGGCLSCATCHVYIPEAWLARLPAVSSDESAMLEMTACERQEGSRLSCQIELTAALDGLVVHLPASQH